MLLFIDPTDKENNTLAMVTLEKVQWLRFSGDRTSETLMPQVRNLLIQGKRDFKDIKKIAILVGPGPFSKIRTGVAVANALGFALKTEIVALERTKLPTNLRDLLKKPGKKLVKPIYGKAPNITKPKRK